jgi:hypothetical protein
MRLGRRIAFHFLRNGWTPAALHNRVRLPLSPDFFSKAQLQRDLWEASHRKRRKIKPLAV